MDRNVIDRAGNGNNLVVALRKESVDRNVLVFLCCVGFCCRSP